MAENRKMALKYALENRARFLDVLKEILVIPSISAGDALYTSSIPFATHPDRPVDQDPHARPSSGEELPLDSLP